MLTLCSVRINPRDYLQGQHISSVALAVEAVQWKGECFYLSLLLLFDLALLLDLLLAEIVVFVPVNI